MNRNTWIALLLFLVFAAGYITRKATEEIEVKTIVQKVPVETVIDSIVYQTETLKLPADPIDTQAVLNDYYKKRSFDTTVVVNEVQLDLGGIVFENKLKDLSFTTTNLRPTKIVRPVNWQVSGGLILGPNLAAPSLYVGRKKWEIGAGYNVQGDPGWVFSAKYRIIDF